MSGTARLLTLLQSLSIGAPALVVLFPRRRWSQSARIPVAITAFVASTASLFSYIF